MTTAQKYDQPLHSVTGIAMYAKVKEPAKSSNPEFDDAWESDVLIREKDVKRMEAIGHRVRENPKYKDFVEERGLDKDGYSGLYIKSSKRTKKSAGEVRPDGTFKKKYDDNGPVKEDATPPIVRDAADNIIPHENVPLIGNGSLITISFALTPAPAKPKGEWGSRLVALKILDLVEYEPVKNDDVPTGTYVFDPSAAA